VIPHHDWSPYRQMRWITIYNATGQDLDAHSVVEVSAIDEIDDGMFVHHVVLPTEDDSKRVLVLGPMSLQNASYGHATDSNLVFAKCNGVLTPGDELGPSLGQPYLDGDKTGWTYVGDTSTVGGNTHRVIRSGSSCKWVLAKLDGDVCAGDVAPIKDVEFICGNGTLPQSLTNLFGLAGADEDWVMGVYRPSAQAYLWVQTSYELINFLEKLTEPSSESATSLSAGQDPQDMGCDFIFNKKKRPFMKEPCEQDSTDVINFAPKAVLTDLQVNGNCIDGKIKIVWSPTKCDIPDEWETLFCGTDCPTSSQ
jgi:hypothetical protein